MFEISSSWTEKCKGYEESTYYYYGMTKLMDGWMDRNDEKMRLERN